MESMMKPKGSDRASGRPRRPSPKSNDVRQSKGKELPPTPDVQPGTSMRQGAIKSMKDSLAFLGEVEEYFKDVDPGKFTAFAKLLVAQKHGRVGRSCMISQVKELFRGHTEMLKLFNELLHPDLKILFKEDVPDQDLAKLYVAKVKTRSSPSEYTTFIHILSLYNERALTSDEVDQEVDVLFSKSCDLLEEYYDCFQPDRAAPEVQSPLHPRHSASEVSELQREQQSERLQRMCEDIAKRKRKEKGKGVVTGRKQQPPPPPPPLRRVSARLANEADALENRSSVKVHHLRPTRSVVATPAAEDPSRSRSRRLENAEYNGRSICTPSYRFLKPPKNGDSDGNGKGKGKGKGKGHGKGKVSVHRSELAKSVLNEECKLVPTRDSEARKPNPHEEVLFKCETDQYEGDIFSKRLEATAKSFTNFLLKLQEPNIGQMPPMEELLSAVHKRCIQQLYKDDAQEFLAALEENPTRALPILLNRLMLKLEELRSHKTKTTLIWAQVYKNNFHLSLDYLSTNSQPVD